MKKTARAQCHFVSNTHWDREWRYSAQRTRYMLVYLLDMLLDIFSREPDFKSFHMDSQTLPIQDYLEIRPEREPEIRRLVEEGKLLIGPWFCLPDEYCVGGESLVRNLLLGHRMAGRLGHVSKTGYSPFSWGQISQMPQIYQGFGIPFIAFYRGVKGAAARRSEFTWEGPDGSRLLASRLSRRPRFNIWYIVQRPAYWNVDNIDHREVLWSGGHAPFRFVDREHADIDCQYAHPRYAYHREHIPARAEQAYAEQAGDWSTPHRFWSNGHDSSCPDIREARLVEDCRRALREKADVFHSTFEAFQQAVLKASRARRLPVARGEMRYLKTRGSTASLFGWITSARMDIKQDNYRTERALTAFAEPLCAFSALLGAPHPQSFLDVAYNWLLQNHGHDSIGGCSRDVVHRDMLFRSRQAREIGACLTERAMMDIAGAVDLSDRSPQEVALVVYNPTPFARSEVAEVLVETPREWGTAAFDVVAPDGKRMAVQALARDDRHYSIVQSPNDVANMMPMVRHTLRARFADVPGTGYRTFLLRRRNRPRPHARRTLLKSRRCMANAFLEVRIRPNGTLDITDRRTGRVFKGQGYFRDASETGNPWERHTVRREKVFTTRGLKADIALLHAGPLEARFRVVLNWRLPAGRARDEQRRSARLVPFRIENIVTLRKDEPWVEIETELNNTVQDHYLQVSFPSGLRTDTVQARIPFDVVEREIRPYTGQKLYEGPHTEQPMTSFVDLSDGRRGLALLAEGMKAYEAHDDNARTLSLTLLRCFPLRIIVTALAMTDYSDRDGDSQCPGRHRFRYAVMPHRGDWRAGGVWPASERFNLGFKAVQIGPSPHGRQPLERSFLEVEPGGLHLSGIKRSEDGRGWVVRLFNPAGRTVRCAVRLNGGRCAPARRQSPVERVQAEFELPPGPGPKWRQVRQVTLEEKTLRALEPDARGWVKLAAAARKIVTLYFR